MNKMYYAVAAVTMAALVSCNNKEEKVDTAGAVPAKVINTMDQTDIIISEDTLNQADSAIPEVVEAVPEEVAEEINDNIKEEDKKKNKDNEGTDNTDADNE